MSTHVYDQLLDGSTVVVDRAEWERLHPDSTPDRMDDDWAYFGADAEARLTVDGPLVWNGRRWGRIDEAERSALDTLRAVAWARGATS
ncbi:hypothetical protein nbrc107696_45940 [Gordonia spumicola]|uniref:Uncharacterized protein n=1 Tax=Gordonia spumicola TaxID=589161 RepID=A0A7I9V458_9ACTN|nr:hypothetical protein [Gordonia spumicola]GEE00219.1 hypothetical protein nbrc107696_06650 [Gordonia spumicola]GEE04148.1 hypothetical protein nbrc107696_45940 [Gordonia spumicola]